MYRNVLLASVWGKFRHALPALCLLVLAAVFVHPQSATMPSIGKTAAQAGFVENVEAATRPIQDQGSSPYCLFAVNSYLAGTDMWHVAAEYNRRGLKTWDGVTPYNGEIHRLMTEMYGVQWNVYKQGDWQTARAELLNWKPTAITGSGHALVALGLTNGKLYYVDSLHPGQTLTMTENQFIAWWDGWAWTKR